MAHYVPEPILIIVRRIQRMWRRKMADRERVRNRAARTFQKIYRGNMARQRVKLAKSELAGTVGGGLWWVKAHMAGAGGGERQANAAALAGQQQSKAGGSFSTSTKP